jgi:hypothetical protein
MSWKIRATLPAVNAEIQTLFEEKTCNRKLSAFWDS